MDFCIDCFKILDATDLQQYKVDIEPVMETIVLAGCLPLANNIADKDLLVRSICHFIVIGRNSIAIEQCVYLSMLNLVTSNLNLLQ